MQTQILESMVPTGDACLYDAYIHVAIRMIREGVERCASHIQLYKSLHEPRHASADANINKIDRYRLHHQHGRG